MKFKDASHFSPSPRLTLFHVTPWKNGRFYSTENICHAAPGRSDLFCDFFLIRFFSALYGFQDVRDMLLSSGLKLLHTFYVYKTDHILTIFWEQFIFSSVRSRTQIVLKQRGKSHAIYFIFFRFYCLNLLSRSTLSKLLLLSIYGVK